ncbi:acetamidase/formamidase [Cordyceps fumosorosea ARSEF 2679]|uniref:Acetamidase/formamidase n=1 Tax=Cordyceps fumosorosea (strain ARSEF 2679) TaxID=1081104 RepID=A0A162MR39_CORFA|nr:acetamidase/formamidase [Cordyceps fumosorosea ARSEF 2679]OAA68859.1 acetamidase/formamidase [Cordyceps fumosorosea ARSEF 2679]
MAHQHITQSNIHFKWSRKLAPALTVASGAEVTFDLRDGGNNQITPENQATILDHLDFGTMDPGFGPVAVEGAEPGDVLRIDVLELQPGAYGWTAILNDFGLLSDEFPEPALKIWDLSDAATTGYAEFKKGIRVPVRPFLGVMGLAPATDEELPTVPPYDWGGNVDCKHLTRGSALLLPVQTAGALFSCGDGHAAQGDGEVCGTAIETPMRARLRFTLEKGKPWVRSPHLITPPGEQPYADRGQEYAVMGIDADLREATRKAVRSAIEWLSAEKGLERSEAYMLCSVVGDLKIAQTVDMPHYGVVCSIPLGIFVDE